MPRFNRSKKGKFYISHKIEIYPDEYAKSVLDINFGYARYLYNIGIEWRYKLEEESITNIGKFPVLRFQDFGYYLKSSERVKAPFESDRRLIGHIKNSISKNLYEAFTYFYQNPQKFNKPIFHSKKNHQNFFQIEITKITAGYDTWIHPKKMEIIFPKLRWVGPDGSKKNYGHCKISEIPKYSGKPISATFSEYAGHYYVSFTYELDKSPYPKTESKRKIGIDLGVKTFITGVTSDRHKIIVENQNEMKKLIGLRKRVKFYQSKMDKSYKKNNKIKTKNYWRWHKKFRQTWKRICDIKYDMLHKITTKLTQMFGTIKIEDLHIQEITSKNNKISRSMNREIMFSCFRMFRDMLEYKSKLRGVKLQIVDQYFPSSQLCCRCGHRQPMPLKNRVYNCPNCGLSLDRDVNAAINILKETERVSFVKRSQVESLCG